MEYKEYSGKTVDDAITDASLDLGVTSDELDYEIVEKESSGFLGFGSKPAVIKARKKETSVTKEDAARAFLESVFKAMEVEAEIIIETDTVDNVMNIEFKGEDMGILIGKRGATLDSLQYLTSLAVNKNHDDYIAIKLDTEDYRRRRKETLESLARNIAYKVKRTKRQVELEAMNPYERRIIHSTLQNDKYVTTFSEGEEPYRHVVIALKK